MMRVCADCPKSFQPYTSQQIRCRRCQRTERRRQWREAKQGASIEARYRAALALGRWQRQAQLAARVSA